MAFRSPLAGRLKQMRMSGGKAKAAGSRGIFGKARGNKVAAKAGARAGLAIGRGMAARPRGAGKAMLAGLKRGGY